MLRKRRRFTLMPAVALLGLSALATVPLLSSAHLYAASSHRSGTVTVRSGDTLWTVAARYTPAGGDVQETVDRIAATNHLRGAVIVPGQRLRVPE